MPAQSDAMYLKSIALTRTHPCLAYPGRIIVTGKPDRSLAEVLPYLASLPDVIGYNPTAQTLTFRRPRGFLTFFADKVIITQVEDVEEGLQLFETLSEAVNAVWENRNQLQPVTAPRKPPRPLDVYALLPQTNCKQCGEATCMAFAFGLLMNKRSLSECPILTRPEFVEQAAVLETMLGKQEQESGHTGV